MEISASPFRRHGRKITKLRVVFEIVKQGVTYAFIGFDPFSDCRDRSAGAGLEVKKSFGDNLEGRHDFFGARARKVVMKESEVALIFACFQKK